MSVPVKPFGAKIAFESLLGLIGVRARTSPVEKKYLELITFNAYATQTHMLSKGHFKTTTLRLGLEEEEEEEEARGANREQKGG